MIINNGGDVEKLEPSYTSEGKLKQCSHFKASVTVCQEPKCRTPRDTAIPLMGRQPREMKKKKFSAQNLYINIHRQVFTMAKKDKQLRC